MGWLKTILSLIFKTIPSTIGAIPALIGVIKTIVDGISWVVTKITSAIRRKKVKEAVQDAIEKKDTTKLDEILNS